MTAKRALALGLATVLVAPPYLMAAPLASLAGVVTSVTGSPLPRVDIDFVNLDNGRVNTVQTDAAGVFKARLEPGLYTVGPRKGFTVVRGTRVVRLGSGEVESVDLSLASTDPQDSDTSSTTTKTSTGLSAGNVAAVSLFSAALLGAVVRAATLGPPDFNPETPLK